MTLEFNLVKFPIIFPIIYGLILYLFPEFETHLIFITILLLAETHFGATWPFFLNNANRSYIKENRITLISFPIIIAITSLIGFIFLKPTFLLIFFAVNMYHVTRQSFGVCKLYTKEINLIKKQEVLIYIFNFIFFFIGFFRFYFPIINNSLLIILNLSIISLLILLLFFYLIKYGFSDSFYPFVTGLIIFYPICFVDKPIHAILMGVTIHYSQYLYLTYLIDKGRNKSTVQNLVNFKFIFYIFLYGAIMTALTLISKNNSMILSSLLIIPITGQMIHFYIDSFIWKFSDSHNREVSLKYLKV